jgi:DNA invertase Pin-like site-specific DNA recombinase
MARAIAYVSDLTLGHSGETLNRRKQIESISKFASEHQIEIVAWFEDETCTDQVLMRPGIQALLACDKPYDLVICERVWALSRSMKALEPFLTELDRRGVGFDCAASMWDVASQQCRRRSKNLPLIPALLQHPAEVEPVSRVRVAKPARLNFEHLVHPAPPSMNQRF